MKSLQFALLCLLLFATSANAQSDSGSGAIAFTHVPIGGAGAVVGVSSVPSANVLLARTDQFNCYISTNNNQWAPLLKATNTPTGSSSTDAIGAAAVSSAGGPLGNGVGACVADPQTGTNIWVETNGGVFLQPIPGQLLAALVTRRKPILVLHNCSRPKTGLTSLRLIRPIRTSSTWGLRAAVSTPPLTKG